MLYLEVCRFEAHYAVLWYSRIIKNSHLLPLFGYHLPCAIVPHDLPLRPEPFRRGSSHACA